MSKNPIPPFDDLDKVANHLREQLKNKKHILLFAHNGIGKTRLSVEFKEQGKDGDQRDTLYFNAYTEDLFTWDNDLDNNEEYKLKLNTESKFFKGFEEWEMDNRIRPLLRRYTDFDFKIDTGECVVRFYRKKSDNIKVSRGEESIFIWCFFLAIVELAMDSSIDTYHWVKYIYIDDPISSLDENNAIMVAHHLAELLKEKEHTLKTVISSHHALFFNVIGNELNNANKYFLNKDKASNTYRLENTNGTPFFHHLALLQELYETAESDELYTYHFNILRGILEKTAIFHGFKHFSACVESKLHTRIINALSHRKYPLFESHEIPQNYKEIFREILYGFVKNYQFNKELLEESTKEKPV